MSYVSAALRRLVVERAGNCCEYCLQSQEYNPYSFHIEHIIAEKHRGETAAENLGLSCQDCNTFKGTDIASIDERTGRITALFNPRQQKWTDHFRLRGIIIDPLTPEGRVTVFLLKLNSLRQLEARKILVLLGQYPCQNDS